MPLALVVVPCMYTSTVLAFFFQTPLCPPLSHPRFALPWSQHLDSTAAGLLHENSILHRILTINVQDEWTEMCKEECERRI